MRLIIMLLYSPQADTGPLTEMAEDSGAFKTNPANSRQTPGFVLTQPYRCNEASPVEETLFRHGRGLSAADF
jgi:hypothetical protein